MLTINVSQQKTIGHPPKKGVSAFLQAIISNFVNGLRGFCGPFSVCEFLTTQLIASACVAQVRDLPQKKSCYWPRAVVHCTVKTLISTTTSPINALPLTDCASSVQPSSTAVSGLSNPSEATATVGRRATPRNQSP